MDCVSIGETGRRQVYVSPFPGPGGNFMISTDGGSFPRWSHSGRELFYRKGDKMMAVDVQTNPEFRAGAPKLLFEKRYAIAYDVDADGKRFLMIKPPAAQEAAVGQLTIVLNWFEELRRQLPTEK